MADALAIASDPYSHRGTRAIQRMVEYAPSTGGLALWIAHHDDNQPDDNGRSPPPVATDGTTIFYRTSFASLSLEEQTGLVAHEVLHIALRHPQRYLELRSLLGDADLQLFTICADALVNSTLSHLGWLKLPPDAIQIDRLLASTLGIKQPTEKSLLEWDVERLYREIDDRGPAQYVIRRYGKLIALPNLGESNETSNGASNNNPSNEGQPQLHRDDGPLSAHVRSIGASSRADLLPDPTKHDAPEREAEAAREWSERLIRGHSNDGAFSILRTLIADVPKSRIPWEQILRTRLARSLARRPDLSWSRPSRSYLANQGRIGTTKRLPWEPGTVASKSVPRLAVIVDVSGSVDDKLMQRFANEIESITRRQGSALTLIIGDERVREVQHFEPGKSKLRDVEFIGGGGTNFTPMIVEASEHNPDIVVILTDLNGPANTRPRCPVIWAVPEANANAREPFGQKLVLR